jgi:hypothetical protein
MTASRSWLKGFVLTAPLFTWLLFSITTPISAGVLEAARYDYSTANRAPFASVEGGGLFTDDFARISEQGFGDRQNTWAWSMEWWNGYLYVGTNRAFRCVEAAAINVYAPGLVPYPPEDTEIECPAEWEDLSLQAEIWRYSPTTNVWQMVFRSPNNIEIPDHPGKFVAPDIGFRDMMVFTGSDGDEAMYVSGVTARDLYRDVAPLPRLLRSTDGVNWQPVPQEPGTVLGSLPIPNEGIRTLVTHDSRFFMVVSSLYGAGIVYESANPAEGNNSFRAITPSTMRVMEMASYNGYLYIGTRDTENGFAVLKADVSAGPPYQWQPIITEGAYHPEPQSGAVISMKVFEGDLYIGTDTPAEVIRIYADDTWDLLVGTARTTPDGAKAPLSGLTRGFGHPFNIHIWRMEEHEGWLYLGTNDASTTYRNSPDGAALRPKMGFDLFATQDGIAYRTLTRTGFANTFAPGSDTNIFHYGARTIVSTPFGLFVGSANDHYGLQIWRGGGAPTYAVHLPLITNPTSELR